MTPSAYLARNFEEGSNVIKNVKYKSSNGIVNYKVVDRVLQPSDVVHRCTSSPHQVISDAVVIS